MSAGLSPKFGRCLRGVANRLFPGLPMPVEAVSRASFNSLYVSSEPRGVLVRIYGDGVAGFVLRVLGSRVGEVWRYRVTLLYGCRYRL
jgi:hypothetical protein